MNSITWKQSSPKNGNPTNLANTDLQVNSSEESHETAIYTGENQRLRYAWIQIPSMPPTASSQVNFLWFLHQTTMGELNMTQTF